MNIPAADPRSPSWRSRFPQALRRRWRQLRMVGLVLVALLLLHGSGLLEAVGLAIYDRYNRMIAVPGQSEVAVVVGFSESDFAHYPQYPFSDELLVEVLDRVAAAEPAAILLAVLRDVPVEPGHERLLQRYRELDNLYGVGVWRAGRSDGVPAPPVLRDTARHGPLPALTDEDGRVRRFVLASRDGETRVESALLRILADQLAGSDRAIELDARDRLRIGGRSVPPIGPGFGEYRGHPLFPGDLAWMLPLRRNDGVPSISFHELLEGRYDPALLHGRLVVIGPTALSIRQGQHTALNPPERGVLSAVETFAWTYDALHAAATLGWPLLRSPPPWLQWALLLLLAYVCCSGFLRDLSIGRALLRGGLGMLAVLAVGFVAFRLGWWLPVAAALATVFVSGLVAVDNVIRAEGKQRHLLGVLRRVFECLPDPVIVVDGDQRIRLANPAMSRLAAAGPGELDALPLGRLLPGFEFPASTAAGMDCSFQALSGERMDLRLRLPQQRRGQPGEMRVMIVEAVHPRTITDSQQAAQVFEHRLLRAMARAAQQQLPLNLFWLGIADVELLAELDGPDFAASVSAALAQRIRQCFPTSEFVLDTGDGVAWWLPAAADATAWDAAAHELREALAWPLDVPGPVDELDLTLAVLELPDTEPLNALSRARQNARELCSLRLQGTAALP